MEDRDFRLAAPFTGGPSMSIAPSVGSFVDADPVRARSMVRVTELQEWESTGDAFHQVVGRQARQEAGMTRRSHLPSLGCRDACS